jgi:PPOX class probable F420-dependent enzyme
VHLVPITFALLDTDTVCTAVDHKPKRTERLQRLENVRRHPDVALLADHYEDDWVRLWWVRARGRARVIDGGGASAEHASVVEALAEKYGQYGDRPPRGPALLIDVTEWRGWAAGTGWRGSAASSR